MKSVFDSRNDREIGTIIMIEANRSIFARSFVSWAAISRHLTIEKYRADCEPLHAHAMRAMLSG